MSPCPRCKSEMQTDGVNEWCVQADCDYDYDDPGNDGECHLCGGSGELDDECECSAFEDTCCCLNPTPRACPECIERERDAKRREKVAT